MKFKILVSILCVFYFSQLYGETCLTKFTDTSNFSFQLEPYTGQHINVWIVTDDAPTYNCFNKRKDVRKLLSMRNRYRVLQDNYRIRSDGQHWSLLVNTLNKDEISSKTMAGWISHENIIVTNRPMRNLETNIYQKVLVREGDCNNGKALKIFNDRKLKFSNEAIEVRTVFYVYDFFPRSARTPESDETLSLLIGVNPQLDVTSTNAPLLLGWIDKTKVTFWNSRTACEFQTNTKYQLLDKNQNVMFEPEILKVPLQYNELRNPILTSTDKYYKIGAFSKLTDTQLGLRKQIEQIRTGLEVLFIIDGTRSMDHVFRATIEAIKNVSQQLIAHSSRVGLENPRFALLFYRDESTGPSYKIEGNSKVEVNYDYCRQEFSIFPMGNYNRFLNAVSNHIACDSDNTLKESMYMGIVKGVEKCHFDTGADGKPKRLRTIIHLGDAGDNGRGNLTAEKVSEILQHYSIFRYISVNVSGVDSSDFNDSIIGITLGKIGKTNHHNQIDDIAPLIAKNLKEFVENNASRLQEQLNIISKGFTIHHKAEKSDIKSINTEDVRYSEYGKKGIAGTTEGKIGVVSDEILNYAKEVIHANNISLKTYNAFQQYVEGNISKKSPIKKSILVSKTNIEKITTALTSMYEATGDAQKRKEVWDYALKIILGDQTCVENGIELSLEECNKQRNGIPIKAGFMIYTKKQFINLSGEALDRVFCEARVAKEQFRAFVENKYIKSIQMINKDSCTFKPIYEKDINGDGEIVHSEGTNINNNRVDRYFFNMGSGIEREQMAWIPIEHFVFTED